MLRKSFVLVLSALVMLSICCGCEKESEDNRLSNELAGEWVGDYSIISRYDVDGDLLWTGGGDPNPFNLLFYKNNLYFDPYINQNVPYSVENGELVINGFLWGKVEISGQTMSLVLDQTVMDDFSHKPRYFEHRESYYKRIW